MSFLLKTIKLPTMKRTECSVKIINEWPISFQGISGARMSTQRSICVVKRYGLISSKKGKADIIRRKIINTSGVIMAATGFRKILDKKNDKEVTVNKIKNAIPYTIKRRVSAFDELRILNHPSLPRKRPVTNKEPFPNINNPAPKLIVIIITNSKKV